MKCFGRWFVKIGNTLDYSRGGVDVSLRRSARVLRGQRIHTAILAGFALGTLAASAGAQYPGLVKKTDKSVPVLRSVAVLEYTGEAGKPKASRLVPIAVYDGEQLNDGTIYLNRPEPLALAGGTEYELQTSGKAEGVFDVYGSGDINGAWLGFGAWKPLSKVEEAKAANAFNTSSLYAPVDVEDDKPVLKRKHPKGSDRDDSDAKSAGTSAGSGSGSGIGGAKPVAEAKDDSDRPTLKRKTSDDATPAAATAGDKPSGKPAPDADPDRPTIRKTRRAKEEELTSTVAPDPDRPRLKHGKPADLDTTESPRLSGYPPDMRQAVAVSDATSKAEHPWMYSWANPEDETKMKLALEAMARTALGLDAPAAPVKPVRKTAAQAAKAKKSMLPPPEPPAPPALAEEQFRVFELSYGATATLVLTAATPKPAEAEPATTTTDNDGDQPAPPVIKRGKPTSSIEVKQTQTGLTPSPANGPKQKFVTIVAQPDLYGGIMVLYKSVTDSAHLDETPRMRLVDAVDAMGDNRGELLFELRGQTQRQFALFRVLRGSAEQLFATVAIP